MKMLPLLVLFVASAVTSALAAESLPQFNATLTVGKEHRFVLVSSTGKPSAFLTLGETFDGYTLKSYDTATGVLEIERDGKVSQLSLVADAAVANAPAARVPATVADAEAVLNQMHFEQMMERALDRQKKAIVEQFRQVGSRMMAQGANPTEVEAFQQKITGEILGVLDTGRLKADTAKIYSEVFSKQELDQISAFYTTPLGELLAAKQPEVQDRLSAVIQGRMAEVMPKVQQMGREFAAAQKAKQAGAPGSVAPGSPASGTPGAPSPAAPANPPKQ